MKCYNCGEKEYYKSKCINSSKNDTNKNLRSRNDRKALNKLTQLLERKNKIIVATKN